jgi:mannose-6-phosphate isomerase-like protein (cupin superfamily)
MSDAAAGRESRVGTDASFEKGDFHVSHLEDAPFVRGLRPYFKYRDLGMSEATGGKLMAQVIAPDGPCRGPGDRHYHVLDFQMVYVLQGRAKVWFDGVGEVALREGSCMYQRPGVEHRVLEYSDDYTVIEITVPADFETVSVAP